MRGSEFTRVFAQSCFAFHFLLGFQSRVLPTAPFPRRCPARRGGSRPAGFWGTSEAAGAAGARPSRPRPSSRLLTASPALSRFIYPKDKLFFSSPLPERPAKPDDSSVFVGPSLTRPHLVCLGCPPRKLQLRGQSGAEDLFNSGSKAHTRSPELFPSAFPGVVCVQPAPAGICMGSAAGRGEKLPVPAGFGTASFSKHQPLRPQNPPPAAPQLVQPIQETSQGTRTPGDPPAEPRSLSPPPAPQQAPSRCRAEPGGGWKSPAPRVPAVHAAVGSPAEHTWLLSARIRCQLCPTNLPAPAFLAGKAGKGSRGCWLGKKGEGGGEEKA